MLQNDFHVLGVLIVPFVEAFLVVSRLSITAEEPPQGNLLLAVENNKSVLFPRICLYLTGGKAEVSIISPSLQTHACNPHHVESRRSAIYGDRY